MDSRKIDVSVWVMMWLCIVADEYYLFINNRSVRHRTYYESRLKLHFHWDVKYPSQ